MADVEAIVQLALGQRGKRYVFGAQPADGDPNPAAFDCSSFVRWCCHRAGTQPPMEANTYYQQILCTDQGTLIGIDQAIGLPVALLLRLPSVLASAGIALADVEKELQV